MQTSDLLFSTITIAIALFAGAIIYFIAMFIFKRWSRIVILKRVKIRPEQMKGALRSLIPAVCVLIAFPILRFSEGLQAFISHIVTLWIIASIGWLAIRVIHMVFEAILENYDMKAKDNLAARQVFTQIRLIENIIDVGIFVLTIAFMLMSFPHVRQIGISLLASAGVLGIILGFAAQKTLGNFIAGIQIAIAQPIRLDDVVIIENEWGWIEEITLTFVVVRIWDLRRLVVPISYFLEKPFENWTRASADLLGSVFVYTDYTVSVEKVRNELTRILENSPKWDKKVNVLQVTNATEKTVELRALMSAADSPTAWGLRCEVREKLLEFLQQRFPECLPRIRIEMNKSD
ncbi:MAG: mechanosensitive ion channel [Candidatus Aceula meridiana]|nr:mechanosensitive ion channel [Candidatus Aceula meridiana]